jgi:hypothetical protein
MDISKIKEVLFPENIRDKVCGCISLLLLVNGIIYAIFREFTWGYFFQHYLPISIMALFVLITWYFLYTYQWQALHLLYFWPFPVLFVIGGTVFYVIPNLPVKPPDNLLVVIANFQPIPGDNEKAKEQSELVPDDLKDKIEEKIKSGVPMEFPKRHNQIIKGEDEKEKEKMPKTSDSARVHIS